MSKGVALIPSVIIEYLVLINSMYFHPLKDHESFGPSFCLELIISDGRVRCFNSLPHSPKPQSQHSVQWTWPGRGSLAAYCVCVY